MLNNSTQFQAKILLFIAALRFTYVVAPQTSLSPYTHLTQFAQAVCDAQLLRLCSALTLIIRSRVSPPRSNARRKAMRSAARQQPEMGSFLFITSGRLHVSSALPLLSHCLSLFSFQVASISSKNTLCLMRITHIFKAP